MRVEKVDLQTAIDKWGLLEKTGLTVSTRVKMMSCDISEQVPTLLSKCIRQRNDKDELVQFKTAEEWDELGENPEDFKIVLELFYECLDFCGIKTESAEKKPVIQ